MLRPRHSQDPRDLERAVYEPAPAPAASRPLHRTFSAGLVDSALASLATFAAALVANRWFDTATLGVFGLFFMGFVVAATVPAQLILAPAEVALLPRPAVRQLGELSATLRLGAGTAAASALVMTAVVWALAPLFGPLHGVELAPLALTCGAFTLLSPLQDHIRRMAHQVHRSSLAAAVSVVQAGAVLCVVAGLLWLGVSKLWAPFGALAAANLVSGAVGYALLRRGLNGAPARSVLRRSDLTGSGRWLLLSGSLDNLFGFLGVFALGVLSSGRAAGQFEAARQLSQPLVVVATGMTNVLRPRLVGAGQRGDRRLAGRLRRPFLLGLGAATALYGAAVGFAWPLNPLPELFPSAYARTGLLAAFVVGVFLNNVSPLFRSELVGGGRERELCGVSAIGGASYLALVCALAGALGPMAGAVGLIAGRPLEFWALRAALRRLYQPSRPQPAPERTLRRARLEAPGAGRW